MNLNFNKNIMKDKLLKVIDEYIDDVGNYGEEAHHEIAKTILHELKENLSMITEDTNESCKRTLDEFQKSHSNNKELLTDFLKYVKHSK